MILALALLCGGGPVPLAPDEPPALVARERPELESIEVGGGDLSFPWYAYVVGAAMLVGIAGLGVGLALLVL